MSQFFYHHFHTAHHHYSEFGQVFYSRSIRALAMSLVSIFVPIYLVQISNNSLGQALPLIAMYYIGQYAIRGLFSPLGGWLVGSIGAKHVLTISAFLNALSLLSLAYIDQYLWLLAPAALFQGLNMVTFFTALHTDMSQSTRRRKGKQVSSVEITRKLVMSAGPLIGGLIAGTVGIYYNFIAAIILLAVSTVPYNLRDEPTKTKKHGFSWQDLRDIQPKVHMVANIGMGLNYASATLLWPLFIYIIVGSYEKVGVVVALSLALSIFVMRFIGMHDSSKATHKQIQLGAVGTSITHFVRPVVNSMGAITGINVLNDVTFSALVVPYMSNYYKTADRTHRIAYVSLMEMGFGLGTVLSFLLLLVVFLFTSALTAVIAGFVLGAVGTIMAQLINKPQKG